jgi:membrane protease YdiL (CAAX protease family)
MFHESLFLNVLDKGSTLILLWAFLIGLGGLNISGILIVAMEYLFPAQMAAYVEMIETSIGSANILLSLISAVILAPLVEEVVMRGMLFRWFEKTNIKPWALIILSGLFFGIWHLNLIQGVFTTVIGIVYALAFMMTKSLWVPLVMHFSNNAFATAMVYLPDTILESHLFMILSYLMILLVPIGFIKIKKELMKIDSMELSGRYGYLMKPTFGEFSMNRTLLVEILSKREPELVTYFSKNLIKEIDEDLGNHIRSILTEEFLETGMDDPDGVIINKRGKEIEELIDYVGNLFM